MTQMKKSPICAYPWKRSEFDAFGIYLRCASIVAICVNSEP